ncbi:AP-1 complex subunit gamma-like 2 isoform X1 [Sphaerodactylus townsendi]|uniref:AP-1 complex subunit gamma-like 2 isoform X1 n=2 Tax=Sphaerodactylus townsendi TaxID=933632 RepID=UPI002026414A|nr:AP-1 complex subunit gamma-like 2 isoform X1 [Sphaerodactylus townsendi]XP_048372268.1 AP-1 complex subunit gamma-like 2 isoform X1 [Sphaerodactylus townsendi]XP_048372269.1 AP-1 complex subunit gamma-like 2 isoform X1 [Sphaerodactylus townsendi]
MLGYPAYFGQMECLKLIASQKFHEKRIGYLGAALLLDEKQDTHLLLTNSIKNDLSHPSAWVQSLALSTLGSLGSAAMFRDLAGAVEQLAQVGQPSVRRKAVVCAVHIIRKVPDLTDTFVALGEQLLTERNHSILHGAVMLIAEMCRQNPQTLEHFRKHVPQLVGLLQNLVVAGYSPESSISGINDPFLQVQIVRLLRILGRGNEDTSDSMNDVLAQVATNTETTRNVGNAILYETVLTIMGVHSASGLRVLAVNILGRFLVNKDRNIRYVALTSLQKLLQEESSAVQRHRSTILACLSDPDATVKRRALQLSLALVNHSNVRATIKELLDFLSLCAPDLKSDCASGIFLAAEKFAPNKRWHVDTILQVLTTAGSYVRDDAVPNLTHLIGGAKELHGYAVQQLYQALAQDISQQPLVQVATWCIGEYGNLLLAGSCEEVEPKQVDPEEMLSLLERVLQSHLSWPATRGYALTALMKLGTHLQGNSINRIRSLVSIYCSCHDIELQQRAVEYNALFRKYDHLRASILEKMPLVEKASYGEDGSEKGQPGREANVTVNIPEVEQCSDSKQPESSQVSDLLNLLGEPTEPSPLQPAIGTPVATGSVLDLLKDLKTPATALPRLVVYERDELLVEFSMERPPLEPTLLLITATVSNRASSDVTGFSLQVAVPKSFEVELLAPSGSTVPRQGGPPIIQSIRVLNPRKLPLRMRLRLAYTLPSGATVQQIEEIHSFPEAAWQ